MRYPFPLRVRPDATVVYNRAPGIEVLWVCISSKLKIKAPVRCSLLVSFIWSAILKQCFHRKVHMSAFFFKKKVGEERKGGGREKGKGRKRRSQRRRNWVSYSSRTTNGELGSSDCCCRRGESVDHGNHLCAVTYLLS